MVNGWARRIARVDLTSGNCRFDTVPAGVQHEWLGGRGLGVALIREHTGLEPFAADLPLVFACGPLCGTATPTSSRCVLTGRSPLTGTIFSCSSGGAFAWQLRRAGLDALVVTGASAVPVMVAITPAEIGLQPAGSCWGLPTDSLFSQLQGQGAVAAIGPAGENGVLFASVETSGGEPFGRGGLGAVMGRRGLKAIIISGGESPVSIGDRQAFDLARQDMQRLFLASPFLYGPFGIREHGTLALVDLLARRRMLPARNFTAVLDGDGLNAAALQRHFSPGGFGCHDCPVACKRLADDGLPLPEYDDLIALAGCCEKSDLSGLVAAWRACAQLGLDPVSAAGSVAAWSETTGQPVALEFLNSLLVKIACREGQGALLAQGAQRLTDKLGEPQAAMTVKGLELPPYDPRGACGLALACAVSTHGGTPLDAWPLASEILRKPVPTDPASFDGKARMIALAEAGNAAMDSLALCRFASCAIELEECAAVLAAVTGQHYGQGDLLTIGQRIIATERDFNQSNGFAPVDDRLPERFFSSGSDGVLPLDRQDFDLELERYQRIRCSGQAF